MDEKPNLLPCPFCGGNAYYTRSVNGNNMHYVGCAACGIAFKAAEVWDTPVTTKLSKDIVAAWNARAIAPISVAEELWNDARYAGDLRTAEMLERGQEPHDATESLRNLAACIIRRLVTAAARQR